MGVMRASGTVFCRLRMNFLEFSSMSPDICQFDGYKCFRGLHCFSRFRSDYRCPRWVLVKKGRFKRRLVKEVVSNG